MRHRLAPWGSENATLIVSYDKRASAPGNGDVPTNWCWRDGRGMRGVRVGVGIG
jgi:hypothetical protein